MLDVFFLLSYQSEPGGETQMYRLHSESTAQKIDEACRQLVDEAYARTVALITEKKEYVENLGDKLLEIEQLGHDELVEVLGPRPFKNDSYVNFLKNTAEFAQKYGEASVKEKTVKDDRKNIVDENGNPIVSEEKSEPEKKGDDDTK